jgi:enterobactin synthetase component D
LARVFEAGGLAPLSGLRPDHARCDERAVEERPHPTAIARIGGGIPCVTSPLDEPELLWLPRGLEQGLTERGRSGLIGTPCYDHDGSWRDLPDDVYGAGGAKIEAGHPVSEPGGPDRGSAGVGVLRTQLRVGVAEGASDDDSEYPRIGGRHRDDGVAACGYSERADAPGRDILAAAEKIESSDKRAPLGGAKLDAAFALSLTGPVEHQNSQATANQLASVVEHARPIGLRSMTENDSGAVARRNVPAADVVPIAAPEIHIADSQGRGVSGSVDSPTSAGEGFRLFPISADSTQRRNRTNRYDDHDRENEKPQTQSRVDGYVEGRVERDVTLLLIPAPRACKVPTRVTPARVPSAIAATIAEIRERGARAAACCVVIHSQASDAGQVESVAIACPRKLDSAAPRRLATFAAGRYCATRAAADVGATAAELAVGEDGAPMWPAGITGCISHADAFAASLVASHPEAVSIGIDYEPVVSYDVADEIEKLVFTDRREVRVGRHGIVGLSWPQLVTLTFSAKETLYKALRSSVGRFFEFHDVRLVALSASTATLQLETDLGGEFKIGRSFTVRYSFSDGCAATALAILDNSFTRTL